MSDAELGTPYFTEHKYSYTLDGTLYFIFLTVEEKCEFEKKYNVSLSLVE